MLFPAQMGATARAEQSRSSTAAAGKESKNIILAISRLSVEGSARGSGLQASAAAVDAKSLSSPPDVASDCAFVLLPSPSPSLPPSFPQVNFLFSLSLSLSLLFSLHHSLSRLVSRSPSSLPLALCLCNSPSAHITFAITISAHKHNPRAFGEISFHGKSLATHMQQTCPTSTAHSASLPLMMHSFSLSLSLFST